MSSSVGGSSDNNQTAQAKQGPAVQQAAGSGGGDVHGDNRASASDWADFTTDDGRVYYFNRVTQVTSWEKPDELKTQQERDSVWKEYMKDGRPYWYNTVTKKPTWERPAELGSGKEVPTTTSGTTAVATANTNKVVESVAEEAPARKTDEEKYIVSSPSLAPVPVILSPPSTAKVLPVQSSANPTRGAQSLPLPTPQMQPKRPDIRTSMPMGGPPVPRFRPPPPVPPAGALEAASKSAKTQRPEYRTLEEAERAFAGMLKLHNVGGDWTWEQTLRAVVNDPDYRALKTLAERKDAFHRYIEETREIESERRKQLAKKRRDYFFALLDSLPVCEVTRFRKVRHLVLGLQQDDANKNAFAAVPTDEEKIRLFNAYVDEMSHDLKVERRKLRGEQIKAVEESLIGLKVNTRWPDVKSKLLEEFGQFLMPILSTNKEERMPMNQPAFYRLLKQENAGKGGMGELKDPEGGLSLLDFMDAFDIAIKRAEKRDADQKQRDKECVQTQERQNRDVFRQLLSEYNDKITPESTWTEFYPLVKADQRYIAMLGQAGSSPLELFWDKVELLNEDVYHERRALESVMRTKGFRVNPDTQLSEIQGFVEEACRESERPSSQNLEFIYQQLVARARRRKEEEEERLTRQRNRLLDDFRYALYDIEPELDPEKSTWEIELPRIRRLPEYRDINDEDSCKKVFELVIERQREHADQKRRRRENEPRKRPLTPDHDDVASTRKRKDEHDGGSNLNEYSSELEEGEMVI
ncbi:U1 snRNP protein [Coemansia sp. BCRC 34490]|nr:U1 snRNP protein [Coemansia sp. BCRC 34490]